MESPLSEEGVSVGEPPAQRRRTVQQQRRPIRTVQRHPRLRRTSPRPEIGPISEFTILAKPHRTAIDPSTPSWIQNLFQTYGSSIRARFRMLHNYIETQAIFQKMEARHATLSFIQAIRPISQGFLFKEVDQLTEWIAHDRKLYHAFLRVVALWRLRKARPLNTDDPFTLETPKRPIRLYDRTNRGYWQFHAPSLTKHIDAALGFSSWLFPQPKVPCNPFTNLPFTPSQLRILFHRLREAGQSSWKIEAFSDVNLDLEFFLMHFHQPLKLGAIYDLFRNPTSEQAIELLKDFIEQEADFHEIDDGTVGILFWGSGHAVNDLYIREWRVLFRRYHRLQASPLFQDTLNEIHEDSLRLFQDTRGIRSLQAQKHKTRQPRLIPPPTAHEAYPQPAAPIIPPLPLPRAPTPTPQPPPILPDPLPQIQEELAAASTFTEQALLFLAHMDAMEAAILQPAGLQPPEEDQIED